MKTQRGSSALETNAFHKIVKIGKVNLSWERVTAREYSVLYSGVQNTVQLTVSCYSFKNI